MAAAGACAQLLEQLTGDTDRALEDVILPEIEGTLRDVESHLEEVDQEEAIRTRLHYGSKL